MIQQHLAGSDRHCFAKQLAPERPPTAATVPVLLGSIPSPGPGFFRRVEGTHPWIVNALRNWSNAASIVKRMNRRCFWQIGLFQAGMFDATTISDRSYLSSPRIGN
jgi:hypothetical protein